MAGSLSKTVYVKVLATDAEAQAKIDEIHAKAEELARLNPTIEVKIRAAAASAELAILRRELKATADQGSSTAKTLEKDVGGSVASLGQLTQGLQSPMAALVASITALAPIVAGAGIGLLGLGAAAYKSVGPVLKAAQATGGLAANLSKLHGPQLDVAEGFLSLDKSYTQFSNSLQPEVFQAIGDSIRLVKTLLKEIQPVSAAAGKGLDTFLQALNSGLHSQQWEQFFTFLAQHAQGDVQLLGQEFGDLLNVLPPLIEQLQPLSEGLLKVTDAATKVLDVLVKIPEPITAITKVMNEAPITRFGRAVTGIIGIVSGYHTTSTLATSSTQAFGQQLTATQAKAQAAAQAITQITNAYTKLVGNMASRDQVLVTTRQDFDNWAKSIQQAGKFSLTARGNADTYFTEIQNGLTALNAAGASQKTINRYLGTQIGLLETLNRKHMLTPFQQRELDQLKRLWDNVAGAAAGAESAITLAINAGSGIGNLIAGLGNALSAANSGGGGGSRSGGARTPAGVGHSHDVIIDGKKLTAALGHVIRGNGGTPEVLTQRVRLA